MKRTYCNCCDTEITNNNFFSYNSMLVKMDGVEIKVRPENTVPMDWDVCRYCVIDAIAKLDDRPKDACEASQ